GWRARGARRGNGWNGGRLAWRARAIAWAATLAAVTFTAGCAGLGTSAPGGQDRATAVAAPVATAATGSPGQAAAARTPASPHPGKPTATPARPSASRSPTVPAAGEPPQSAGARQPAPRQAGRDQPDRGHGTGT